MMVQNVFASNLQSSRDVGLNILSDEDQYTFNYAFGIWGGVGPNLARDGTSVSQNVLPPSPETPGAPPARTTRTYNYDTRFMSGELHVYGPGAVQNCRQSGVWAGRHPELPHTAIGHRLRVRVRPGSELSQLHTLRYCRSLLPPGSGQSHERPPPWRRHLRFPDL
mgnify:CR=1 FL=1